jgi:hypothetical protein
MAPAASRMRSARAAGFHSTCRRRRKEKRRRLSHPAARCAGASRRTKRSRLPRGRMKNSVRFPGSAQVAPQQRPNCRSPTRASSFQSRRNGSNLPIYPGGSQCSPSTRQRLLAESGALLAGFPVQRRLIIPRSGIGRWKLRHLLPNLFKLGGIHDEHPRVPHCLGMCPRTGWAT